MATWSVCLVTLLICVATVAAREDPPVPTDLILLTSGNVYAPEPLGLKDILLAGGSILGVVDPLSSDQINLLRVLGFQITVYNLNGSSVIPGLIDVHVHVTGGGGELGPASRTPEAVLSELVTSGITTLVGVLGTDSVSRSLKNLLFKVRAINADGLTAFMYTGSYRVPVPVLTSSVMDDIALIEQVIGVGELAVSDYRSSVPSFDELARIASDCKIGSLISGKSGIIHVHVGAGRTLLNPLWEVIDKTEVPITQFHLTHVSTRGATLADEARKWLQAGGTIDLTADTLEYTDTAELLSKLQSEGQALNRVTVSSDAYGSFPVTGEDGNIIRYGVGKPDALLITLRSLIRNHGFSLQDALQFFTSNVARIHLFTNKGRIQAKYDGDLVVLDSNLEVQYVFARGKTVKTPGWVKKGMFEP